VKPFGRRLAGFLGVTLGAGVLMFGAGATPERCPDLTPGSLRAAATSAADWIIDNQQPDGTWLYEYDRVRDRASDDYNIVRHAGVMSSLYQAGARDIDGAIASADRGLAWALDHVVERDDWAGVTTTNTIQAGTNALLLAALVERREATGDETYDVFMGDLARFLERQVEPNGALLAYYDLGPEQARPDTYSIYYTGEAYWALARMHRVDPSAGWGDTADRMGEYMATVRDDAEDIWPPLADHWSGYGLAETAAFPDRPVGEPLTDEEVEFVRRQGGLIGQRVRSISQRFGPWGPAVRGTFTPRGGGYGVFGEGLAGLWRAAQLDDRLVDERAPLAERALCISGLAVEAQVDREEAAQYPDPGKVEGAWFIDDVTRMDDQQHALSALLLTMPILEAVPFDTGHPAPAAWLWILVILGTINPFRAAFSMPRNGTVGRRTSLALRGGLLGSSVLLIVGLANGWVIDLVGTSEPAMRLAAGSLCLLSAGIDVARRPTTDEPALGGLRAAIMPVALPLFVRPAMLLAGFSVVADHGPGVYAIALAVSVAVLTGLSALGFGADPERPVLVWVGRVLSFVAVAGAALLIADAVFDI
jgi:small neutral amino acid transporter SnatA (MarC family)